MGQLMTFRCIGIRRFVVDHPDGHSFGFKVVKKNKLRLEPDGLPVWKPATMPASQQAKHDMIAAAFKIAEQAAQARGDLS